MNEVNMQALRNAYPKAIGAKQLHPSTENPYKVYTGPPVPEVYHQAILTGVITIEAIGLFLKPLDAEPRIHAAEHEGTVYYKVIGY